MFLQLSDKATQVQKRQLMELVSMAVQMDVLTVQDLMGIKSILLRAVERSENLGSIGGLVSETQPAGFEAVGTISE